MPSPFPGMDPYIETQHHWTDFHVALAAELRAWLNTAIQPTYYATIVPYVAYDTIDIARKDERATLPTTDGWPTHGNPPATKGVTRFERDRDPWQRQGSVIVEAPFRLANVEIRQTGTDKLVTALEILSPITKRVGREQEKYQRKRRELLRIGVHVVEIDLLRGGQRSSPETPPLAPYYVTLWRAARHAATDIWAIQLNMGLPVVPVPRRTPDPDIMLDLGAVVRAAYKRGGYAKRLDYHGPVPAPALDAKQLAWVDTLLTAYRKH